MKFPLSYDFVKKGVGGAEGAESAEGDYANCKTWSMWCGR